MSEMIPEPTETDDIIVACMPVAMLPVPYVSESVREVCAKCGAEVWRDPAQTFPHPPTVLCIRDAMAVMEERGAYVMNPPVGMEPFKVEPMEER